MIRFFRFLKNNKIIWPAVIIFASLYWISQRNYLLFHSLAEMFSILTAGSVFVLAWNTRDFLQNSYLEVLGIGMLFVAVVDLLHTLAFKGMGVFPGNSADLPTQLWLAGRFLHSGATLVAALLVNKEHIQRGWVLAGFASLTAMLLGAIAIGVFPVSLVESDGGVSLTPFKIVSEYSIILVFLISMVLLWRARATFDRTVLNRLMGAAAFSILAEILFTGYIQVNDLMNLIGHLSKLAAFYLIYKAIVETGFLKPFNLLFRELNQSDSALRASEQRERERAAQLEAVMDAVPAVVWIANDPDSKTVTGNRASYEFLRMQRSANQSKSADDDAPTHFKVLKDGRELAPEELPLQLSAATGQPVRDFEETVLFDNGEARQLYGNVSPLLDSEGKPAGAVSVFIDITERVLAEQALQESERRYRQLFEMMTEGFAVHEVLFDDQGHPDDYQILEANPAFIEMAGLPRAELIGKPLSQLRPHGSPVTFERYVQVVKTGESQRYEDYSNLLKRHVEVLLYHLGENRVASLITDITQRRRDQQALRTSEARLRRLVESNIIGIVYADANGGITLANDAFLDLVGYTREDLKAGRVNWMQMTPPEYLPLDAKGVAEASQHGACAPYEKEYFRKDGSRVPILIGFANFAEASPPYIAFVLDLTARKQAEERLETYALQLERSNRELQEFAFVASHDLQEPLRKIQAFGDRLKSTLGERLNEGERDYLERMQNSATRMRTMVNDLLALSRVTTRGKPFEPVDLNLILLEVLSDLDVRIERCQGQVTVDHLPPVFGDPTQMHQLFLNLVGNALKFHKPGIPPVVEISARPADNNKLIQISVRDNGIGFEEQYLDRIFQPFQRLYGIGQYEGSGIGLAICRKIVERHAGEITARSSSGQGAEFIVRLPVV